MKAFSKKMNSQKGFTLLEMLLVIAVIGILAGIVIVALSPGRQLAQARNAQRKSDLAAIHTAMNLYFVKELEWPATIPNYLVEICDTGNIEGDPDVLDGDYSGEDCVGDGLIDLSLLVPDYLASIPIDPQGPELGAVYEAYAADGGTGYFVGLNSPTDLAVMTERSTEYDLPLVAIGTSTDTGSPLEPEYTPYALEGGASKYASMGDSSDWTFGSGDWSISYWAYATSVARTYLGTFTTGGIAYNYNVIGYFRHANAKPAFWIIKDDDTSVRVDGDSALSAGQWYWFVIQREGDTVKLYINNALQSSTGNVTGWTLKNPTGGLYIETDGDPVSNYFTGYIDEFLVFNGKYLSAGERDTLYNDGGGLRGSISSSPWNSNLSAGYHFDEGSGSVGTDFSGSGNELNHTGSPSYVSGHVQ